MKRVAASPQEQAQGCATFMTLVLGSQRGLLIFSPGAGVRRGFFFDLCLDELSAHGEAQPTQHRDFSGSKEEPAAAPLQY